MLDYKKNPSLNDKQYVLYNTNDSNESDYNWFEQNEKDWISVFSIFFPLTNDLEMYCVVTIQFKFSIFYLRYTFIMTIHDVHICLKLINCQSYNINSKRIKW